MTRKGKFIFYIIGNCSISAITILIAYYTGKFFDYLTGLHNGYNLVGFCLLIAILSIGNLVLQYCSKMANIKLNFDAAYEMSCDIIDTVHNARCRFSYRFYDFNNLQHCSEHTINNFNSSINANYI